MELEYENNNDDLKDVSQPVAKKPRLQKNLDGSSPSPVTKDHFSFEDLQRFLFNKSDVRPIGIEQSAVTQRNECFWCDASSTDTNFQCPRHKHENPAKQLTLALRSLPPEVGLCESSVTRKGYGICAKRTFPVGAWIGPYEGTFVKPEELSSATDTSYMWEIFRDGKLVGYIDGSNENVSSWMRFIRCARHRGEQNLFAFQYLGKVFYRTFKKILPGQEMLVWYDEKYPQYLGVPQAIFDLGAVIPRGASSQPDEVIVVSSHEINQPLNINTQDSFFPSPPPSPVSNPGSPLETALVSINEPSQENLSSPMQHGLLEPASYTKSVPKQSNSPLEQNNGDSLKDPQQGERETSLLTQRDLNEKTALATNSFFKSTSEPSSWTRVQSPLKPSFLQTSIAQKFTSTQIPQEPFQCGHCPASFSNVNQLRTHAVIHVSKKPFKCGYCSRSFSGSTTLNSHIRSHIGGRLFAFKKRSSYG
ncbi:hypothetical protein ACROYT_G000047 [Oculina patagonica]